jgi:hypothetical protein
VQTWRQLAAVAEPARGCGRILIIASAGVEPRRGRRDRHHPRWRSPSPPSPTAKAPRWAACRHRQQPGASLGTALVGAVLIANLTTGLVNGVQDSSAIPANVTTQATTQLEAGVPSPPTATRRPSSRRQTSLPTRPDATVKANSDVRLAIFQLIRHVVTELTIGGALAVLAHPKSRSAQASPSSAPGRDPNTTLAIFEGSAEDGCAVDDWDQ